MNKVYDTIITHEGVEYGIKIGDLEDGPYCSVRLLPYECLLFSANLEWLVYSGELEDGDATHRVHPEALEKILEWTTTAGYELQY